MGLREHMREVQGFVESDLERITDSPPLERAGKLYEDLASNLRILAGCALLLDGDTDAYYSELTKSGHARLHFLARRSEKPLLRSPYLAAGTSQSLFDVLAARNFEIARQIAARSPTEWWEGEEYEEDFCFAHFFHQFIQGVDVHRGTLAATADRLGEVTDGDDNSKVRVCKALLAGEQDNFDEAFTMLLEARSIELSELKERFWPDGQIGYRVNARLYIDALAILNVADTSGLRTVHEYPYCPRLARVPASRSFPASLFSV